MSVIIKAGMQQEVIAAYTKDIQMTDAAAMPTSKPATKAGKDDYGERYKKGDFIVVMPDGFSPK